MKADNPELRLPSLPAWLLPVFPVCITGFLFIWFQEPLFSPDFSRASLWSLLFDELLGIADSPLDGGALPSGIQFLPQRWIPIRSAVILLVLAGAHGAAISRWLFCDIQLWRSEKLVLGAGLGLGVQSLVTLGAGLFGSLTVTSLVLPAVCSAVAAGWPRRRNQASAAPPVHSVSPHSPDRSSFRITWPCLFILMAFSIWLLLGAMSPQTDFDVREYHLQGPKEWYGLGRIQFLRHNVYTSFPFLSEMMLLAGMVVTGDWWQGALAGQLVLACFQLLSCLTVFSVCRRWFGTESAYLASVIYLTTPWTLRISLIAYAEGALTFYLMASTMLTLIVLTTCVPSRKNCLLIGMLAGCAMASKYTGLVSVVFPMAVLLSGHLFICRSFPQLSDRQRCLGAFLAGVLIMTGPWLLRNLSDTGNPVYPLGYSLFGGTEWSPEMNVRWKAAHGPSELGPAEIFRKHIPDVTIRNTWTSGLLFALAFPAVVFVRTSRPVRIVVLLCAWNFFTWWLLTHRIDRFWIPAIPLLSVLAGMCRQLSGNRWWRLFILMIIFVCILWQIRFCMMPQVGYHAGLSDLTEARQIVIRDDIRYLNRSLSSDHKVLMVGDAEVFDATFPLVYNTVFDDSIFEEWTSGQSGVEAAPVMLPAEQIRRKLHAEGITHIHVHWGEILRYRLPGSYGYPAYIQPSRFELLCREGVLNTPQTLLRRPVDTLSATERQVIESWDGGSELFDIQDQWVTVQLFEVVP